MQIYKITNLITGLSYIGKDQRDDPFYMGSGLLLWKSYRKRFNRESLDENNKSHHKWVYEQNQIYHYYEKIVLYECNDKVKLCEMEKYYIQLHNTIRPNGYNIAAGGEGGCLIAGYTEAEKEQWKEKISETTKTAMSRPEVKEKLIRSVSNKSYEWRKHISESLAGRRGIPMSEETKEKLRQINIGNKYGVGNKSRTGQHNSAETNRRISEAQKSIVHTAEWNNKVSNALKGKPKSEAHKQALRKPKPKYKWLLPDGTIKVMDAANGSKHVGWIQLEKIEGISSDQAKLD